MNFNEIFGDIQDAFSGNNNMSGLLGMDNDAAGMLGLGLMNETNPDLLMLLLGNEGGNQITKTNTLDGGYLPSDKQAMLQQLKRNAEMAFPGNPMMQQVSMTQAIHESGLMNKPSELASQYNNLFGIKAPGTAGTVNMNTGEYRNGAPTTENASFGRNISPADSFIQYKNLMNRQRYAPVLNANNPSVAFNALQTSGYATDPHYANKLSTVYNQYVAPLY